MEVHPFLHETHGDTKTKEVVSCSGDGVVYLCLHAHFAQVLEQLPVGLGVFVQEVEKVDDVVEVWSELGMFLVQPVHSLLVLRGQIMSA